MINKVSAIQEWLAAPEQGAQSNSSTLVVVVGAVGIQRAIHLNLAGELGGHCRRAAGKLQRITYLTVHLLRVWLQLLVVLRPIARRF